jgi:4-hydroxybenzoate polyprenyltransferase
VGDAEEDRLHPSKRFGPIAVGAIDPRFATALGLSLLLAGVLLRAAIGPLFGLVGVAYAALTPCQTRSSGGV